MKTDNEKQVKRRIARRFYRALGTVFALILAALFLLNIVLPDREMSLQEKRVLKSFPAPEMSRVLEGAYSDEFEAYASDQIPFRNAFTRIKVFWDRLLGKDESQGVYRGKDGYLIERMDRPDLERVSVTLEAAAAFADAQAAETLMVLVPNAVSVCEDKLPALAPSEDQKAFVSFVGEKLAGSRVSLLDLSPTLKQLKEKDEERPLYYRTDHHWTTYAAEGCASRVMEALGRTFAAGQKLVPVSFGFTGSLAAKSGFGTGVTDEIDLWVPDREPLYLVTGREGKKATLYDPEKLKGSDPYQVFLGGNEGYLHIETDGFGKGRLLVFKDSYFNCFLPFLLDAYETIDVIDPRYYDGELSGQLLQNEYDQVLFFYNINTFSRDSALSLILREAGYGPGF